MWLLLFLGCLVVGCNNSTHDSDTGESDEFGEFELNQLDNLGGIPPAILHSDGTF